MHDGIISVRVEVWANKTSLTSPLFIEVMCQARKVGGHGFVLGDTDFASYFWNCSNSVVFCCFVILFIAIILLLITGYRALHFSDTKLQVIGLRYVH